MKAYSTDLRQRVVSAYDAREGTQEQLAARFAVSVSWVRKLFRQRRSTGSIKPKPHGGGHAPAFDTAADAKIRQAVRDDPGATPEELGYAAGVACSASAVYRALDRLGITRKKKSRRAAEQDRPELKAERASWRRKYASIDPPRLSSSTSRGRVRRWIGHMAAPPPGCGSTGRSRTATGRSRR